MRWIDTPQNEQQHVNMATLFALQNALCVVNKHFEIVAGCIYNLYPQ